MEKKGTGGLEDQSNKIKCGHTVKRREMNLYMFTKLLKRKKIITYN
jgi:hypothetical protein